MVPEYILLTNLAAILASLLALWCLSLLLRNASIVDIFWGCGFAVVAWMSLWTSGELLPQRLVLTLMVSVWGLRLAGYLAWRNIGKPEDYRYAAMREHHGKRFPIVSLFTVFGLQGSLMWIISLPIQVGISQGQDWHPVMAIGLFLWVAGLFFETVGDFQLARFKADPRNQGCVMNRGLWRYTRHPNYFGDFLVWWGFYFVAAESGSWWWTIIGPLLMSFLLIRVSGVRLLENSLRSRVAGYEAYVRDTSAFLPLPPKQSSPPK
jgi:steroid 5-alpha reductase family enzyme